MQELESEIKQLIIDTLNLEDITIADIDTNAPIFGEGLGLDSIDSLELGLAIKKKYKIVLNADDPSIRDHFSSVANLVKFIAGNQAQLGQQA